VKAKETVNYLNGLKSYLQELDNENGSQELTPFVEALETAVIVCKYGILQTEPSGVSEGKVRWAYLPDAVPMPFEHLNMITGIAEELDRFRRDLHGEGEECDLVAMTSKQAEVLESALAVYQAGLMDAHRDRIREGLEATIKSIGKAQREGRLDT